MEKLNQANNTAPSAFAQRVGLEGKELRMVLLIVGFFFIGVTALYLRSNADAAVGAARPLTVETISVVFDEAYQIDQRYAGRVEARRETRLAFERAGLVTAVNVEEGDEVLQGQVIATMDTEALRAQRTRLEADRQNALAQLELARLTTKRQQQLSKEGYASVQRFDDARLSASALSASVASIEATIKSIDIDIQKSTLVAPYDGVVGAVLMDQGAVINAGMGVADIWDTEVIQARIGLPPSVAGGLNVGLSYRVSYAGRDYESRLIALRPDIDSRTQTIAALLDLPDEAAIPYREVVHFLHTQTEQASGAWLPLSALVEGEKGLWSVFVAETEEGQTRIGRESVEVVHVEDSQVYVRGTLKPGSLVLTGGTNRVAPGQRVALAE